MRIFNSKRLPQIRRSPPPESLTLSFSEGIETAFSAVTLTGPQQKAVATGKLARSDSNKAQLIVPLTRRCLRGVYR